jgi:glycosyltransferase involved in cell wall biosynthesis
VVIVKNIKKISVITNIPTPYRQIQWKYYSKEGNLDLTLYYCAKSEKDRRWNLKKMSNVCEKFMKGVSISNFHFNPGIFRVINVDCDLFVVGSYGYPTVMIAILLLRLLKRPWVLIHDGISPLKLNNEKWYVKVTKRIFLKGANAYFANGTVGKCDLQNYGISEEKIFNQYLTVDINDFMQKGDKKEEFRQSIRSKYGIDSKSIVLMYSGRLIKSKGVQDLLSAVDKLINNGYNIRALIVGEGSYKKELENYSREMKLEVVFTGHIEPEEILKYYYASDIFILPTHDDPWGLVVNEAMACGLPIITSEAAGCSIDLVKNNGYVVSRNNVGELCDAIIKLLDSKVRISYGKRSKEIIKDWSYENSLKNFNDLIQFIKR